MDLRNTQPQGSNITTVENDLAAIEGDYQRALWILRILLLMLLALPLLQMTRWKSFVRGLGLRNR